MRESLAAGLTQMVILGAGFDTRGLRMPDIAARRVSVFEVDSAVQLNRKRTVLKKAGVKLPPGLTYVPFDFDAPDFASSLTSVLEEKGFRPGEGALFVWEGVIGYIDDAIDQSLRFMAGAGGARSRQAFTFAHIGFETDTAARRTPHPNAWVTRVGTAFVRLA